MMPVDAIGNLAIYSLQIAAIIAGASILPWALKLDNAGARYAYWRAIGVLCLVLPWIQPYTQRESRSSSVVDSVVVNAVAASARDAGGGGMVDWALAIVSLLALGAVLRLSWLGVGLYKLRSLRLSGSTEPAVVDADLQHTLGTRADIRHAASVGHPVTFGLLRPVVLLPESLREQSADIRRAVVAHELVHVKRRDWTWLVAEEVVVCLLWFHPAVWWLVSRIQLAREEVVDELAILATGRRKAYVEALLMFADSTSVLPIAAFARRRHLFRRIALVSKEDVMSSRRIVASCAAMALVVGTGSWFTVSAFPMRGVAAVDLRQQAAPGALERRAHAVTPENPIPRRVHHQVPLVPDIPGVTGGTLLVKVTLDDAGRVAEARVIEMAVKGANFNVGLRGDDLARQLERTVNGMPADAAAVLRQAVPAFVESALASVRGSRYDPPAEGPLTFSVPVRIGAAPEVMAFKPAGNALRVGGGIRPPVKVYDVPPVYPPIAQAANVSGVVILETRIGADGSVEEAHVLRSIPLLDQAALDAVKQWKFEPTLLNGQPVPIMMTTTINFTLAEKQSERVTPNRQSPR